MKREMTEEERDIWRHAFASAFVADLGRAMLEARTLSVRNPAERVVADAREHAAFLGAAAGVAADLAVTAHAAMREARPLAGVLLDVAKPKG